MTNEQILEQQVEALEKLLQLKQAVIGELEAKVQRLQHPVSTWGSHPVSTWGSSGVVSTPYVYPNLGIQCVDGLGHKYPSTWLGTMPPSCTKCGAQSQGFGTSVIISGGFQGAGCTTGTQIQTTGYAQQPVETSNNGSTCVIPLTQNNAKQ